MLNLAFSHSTYDDIQKFILETPSYEIIMWGAYYLFDFDFSFPENMEFEDFKKYIASIFGGKFFDENIAFETEMAFTVKLRSLTNEIMPYYSKKIALLLESELKNFSNKREIQSEFKGNSKSNSQSNSQSNSNATGTGKNLNSDFPQELAIFDDVFSSKQRLSTGSANSSKSESNIDAENTSENATENNNTTKTVEIYGNIFEFINNFESLKNVFTDLMNEYNKLFSLLF